MANRFWIGNGGNVDDTAHWSATTGGSGGASVPTSVDNVFFDANSFSSASQTVTMIATDFDCLDMDWTGVSNNPTINGGVNNINIYGNLTLVSGMTVTNGYWYISATSGTISIITANKNFGSLSFGINGGTATFNITGDINVPINGSTGGGLILYEGTLNVGANDVSISYFASSNTNVRTLNMGSGTWVLLDTGTVWTTATTTNLTLNTETSTLNISSTSATTKTITTGAITLNTFQVTGRDIIWTGNTTVANLKLDNAGRIEGLQLGTGTKTITGDFTNNGSVGLLTILASSVGGVARTISKASGTVSIDFASIQDSTVTGGASFYAGSNSTDVSGNTGWIFTSPPTTSTSSTSSSTSSTSSSTSSTSSSISASTSSSVSTSSTSSSTSVSTSSSISTSTTLINHSYYPKVPGIRLRM